MYIGSFFHEKVQSLIRERMEQIYLTRNTRILTGTADNGIKDSSINPQV